MTELKRDDEEGWKDDDFLAFVAPKASDDLSESEEDEEEEEVVPKVDPSQLPPWMDHSVDINQIHPLISLHNEIVDFVHLMEPMSEEIRQREKLIQEVKDVVQSLFGTSAEVQVFGSQATGLLLPTSDIDIVIITQTKAEPVEADEEHTWEQSVSTPLRIFADELQTTWIGRLSYLEAIENTRIPLVKFTDKKSNISVDVSFDQPSGPPAAVLMKTYLDAMPVLRPLTFVLKYFLAARALNEPYSGGVGSFMLQLLIVAFLQHRERLAFNYRKHTVYNLGLLLVEFFKFYGLDFNYFTTVISVRNDGFFFPKGERNEVFCDDGRTNLLALENPLDPSSDVGKPSFRFQMVQRAFALAYRTLMAHVTVPFEPTNSILGSILPVSDEMLSRKHIKKRDRPLSAKREGDPTARHTGGHSRGRDPVPRDFQSSNKKQYNGRSRSRDKRNHR